MVGVSNESCKREYARLCQHVTTLVMANPSEAQFRVSYTHLQSLFLDFQECPDSNTLIALANAIQTGIIPGLKRVRLLARWSISEQLYSEYAHGSTVHELKEFMLSAFWTTGRKREALQAKHDVARSRLHQLVLRTLEIESLRKACDAKGVALFLADKVRPLGVDVSLESPVISILRKISYRIAVVLLWAVMIAISFLFVYHSMLPERGTTQYKYGAYSGGTAKDWHCTAEL
jgi:hypothetical protein